MNQKDIKTITMHRKISLTILLTFCFVAIVSAQSDSLVLKKTFHKEISINATNLLSNLFSLANENLSTPYTLVYRNTLSEKVGFHFGLGANYSVEKDILSGTNLKTNSTSYDARLGLDRIAVVSKRLNFIFGLDLIVGNNINQSSDQGFELETTSLKFGGGPAMRIQYNLSDRVVFMTEALFYFVRTLGERQEFDPVIGIATFKNSSAAFSIAEPRALFIGFKF